MIFPEAIVKRLNQVPKDTRPPEEIYDEMRKERERDLMERHIQYTRNYVPPANEAKFRDSRQYSEPKQAYKGWMRD